MSDPQKIREIQESVSIPVMAKCRIGHFVEAQILEALEIDYIDESEVLTPADVEHHVDKHAFVPFVCGATNLREALRRISEGAAMIRTKGEAGPGTSSMHGHAHAGRVRSDPGSSGGFGTRSSTLPPRTTVRRTSWSGGSPRRVVSLVVTFTAGASPQPADAALCMQLGADGVFVGSGIFKSGRDKDLDPDGWADDVSGRAKATVEADALQRPEDLADVSAGLGAPMVDISAGTLGCGAAPVRGC